MIVAFSTSSPIASVAFLREDGSVLCALERPAAQRASRACMAMLKELQDQTGLALSEVTIFAADIGPGSFTGVRVGVTLAKTLAFVHGALTIGASAFDLIDPVAAVALPSRKGEYFVRRSGEPAYRTAELPDEPLVGIGIPGSVDVFPSAARFGTLLSALPRYQPLRLNPEYLIEPNISQPKKPYQALRGQNV